MSPSRRPHVCGNAPEPSAPAADRGRPPPTPKEPGAVLTLPRLAAPGGWPGRGAGALGSAVRLGGAVRGDERAAGCRRAGPGAGAVGFAPGSRPSQEPTEKPQPGLPRPGSPGAHASHKATSTKPPEGWGNSVAVQQSCKCQESFETPTTCAARGPALGRLGCSLHDRPVVTVQVAPVPETQRSKRASTGRPRVRQQIPAGVPGCPCAGL